MFGIGALASLAKIIEFLKKNWKGALIAILIALLAFQTWSKNRLSEKLGDTENQLELKEGELAKFTAGPDGIRTGGNTTGAGSRDFVPPEATVGATLKENEKMKKKVADLNKQIEALLKSGTATEEELARLRKERDETAEKIPELHVDFKPWSFTLRPGIGILYSGEFMPELDCKFFYWGRYSAKFGFTKEFVNLGGSRHIDDLISLIIPKFKPRNLEGQLVGGVNYTGGCRVAGGLRLNM